MASTYFRVSIQGRLPGGEVWSINPIFRPLMGPADPTPAQMLAAATAIANLNPGPNLLNPMSLQASLTGARVEARTADFDLEAVGEFSRSTPLAGTGAATKPFQTAIVLSLRTPFPGASSRGRLYWPGLGASMDSSTGRLVGTNPPAIAAAASVYLTAIQGALTAAIPGVDTFGLVVYSKTRNTSRYVTSVWVGDVIDSQRRRRDALVESYSIAAFPGT